MENIILGIIGTVFIGMILFSFVLSILNRVKIIEYNKGIDYLREEVNDCQSELWKFEKELKEIKKK